MKTYIALGLLLAACSSEQANIGEGKAGSGGTGGTAGGAGSSGSGGSAGSAGSAGTTTGGTGGVVNDGGSCPPLWDQNSMPACNGDYTGSFECYCAQGEMYHPIGCETKLSEYIAKGNVTVAEYSCGLTVAMVSIGFDGIQEYIFDTQSEALVGVSMSSDHGTPCAAGQHPDGACTVTQCTQNDPDAPCPL